MALPRSRHEIGVLVVVTQCSLACISPTTGAEDQKQEGVALCVDLIEEMREVEGVSGVHIMAYRMEDRIGEIVSRSNALNGREPWRLAA
jgi:methylenetetrahydrofolate reductase (NADPH)